MFKKNSLKLSALFFAVILVAVVLVFDTTALSVPSDLTAVPAEGNYYYVAASGNDSNPGTIEKPWRTIQKAADSVQPGETVIIRDGIYRERVLLNRSGTEDNYITFTNYPGEVPVINGEGIYWGFDWDCLFNLNSQSFLKIIGLKVINSSWAGIGSAPDRDGCQSIIIQGCSTYNTASSGIVISAGKNIIIDGNTVEMACYRIDGSQECISLCGVDSFEIRNNHIFNCINDSAGGGGEGINVKNGCSNGLICNNVVHDVLKVAIYIDAYEKYQNNIEVSENIIYNAPNGVGLAAENGGILENITVSRNYVFDCAAWGFVVAGWDKGYSHIMRDLYFTNNFVHEVGEGGIFLNNYEAKNVVIKENTLLSSHQFFAPIHLNGGNLYETTIDSNTFNNVLTGHPLGTNYVILY